MPKATPGRPSGAALANATERRLCVRYFRLPSPALSSPSHRGFRPGVAVLKAFAAADVELILHRPPEVGARLIVQLPGRPRCDTLPRTAVVVGVQRDPEGWLVSCRLSVPLRPGEIAGLQRAAGGLSRNQHPAPG